MRFSPLLSLCLVSFVLACGRHDPPEKLQAKAVTVNPTNFNDSDPHDWSGRHPYDYPVHGVDVSRYQKDIDWQTARANGVSFAYIKATEGGEDMDPLFAQNWAGARAAGLPRGAYHFWYHCKSAAEQARWFIRNVPREAGALPPALDMEWTPFSPTCTKRESPAVIRREAAIFMNMLADHYGQSPIMYSTVDFYRENELWLLRGHDFWLRSVAGHPSEKFGDQHWTFWQYTGTGQVPGIKGGVDINVFAGSAAGWSQWVNASTAP